MNSTSRAVATTPLPHLQRMTGLWAAASLVLFLGCQSPRPTVDHTAIGGEYRLDSVNGSSLPTYLDHGGKRLRIESGSLALHADGTGQSRIVFGSPSGAPMVREVFATYRRTNSTLRMNWKGAGRTVATLDGPVLTMPNKGIVFVYTRKP